MLEGFVPGLCALLFVGSGASRLEIEFCLLLVEVFPPVDHLCFFPLGSGLVWFTRTVLVLFNGLGGRVGVGVLSTMNCRICGCSSGLVGLIFLFFRVADMICYTTWVVCTFMGKPANAGVCLVMFFGTPFNVILLD